MSTSLTLVAVFGAGVVSFLSPCVLPLLPTYTAMLAGTGINTSGKGSQRRLITNTLCFLSGFIVVFMIMGATASFLGQLFFHYQEVIRKAGAIFMILMGIHLSGIVKISVLERDYRPLLNETFEGSGGAFFLGIAFTSGWTPCISPILTTILLYAGASSTVGQGAFLLFVYAMGFCVPFLAAALLLNHVLPRIKGYYKYLTVIRRLSGLLIAIIGTIMYLDLIPRILGFLTDIL
ncbi:MAG TPA: cytochrome c biogenesis protein CcdA [Methylomusa anaerophila]|uniref:Thiol:disulfide interchange protein DsbD n=1 Tax=Methylomusa anaerophila TaxID=1930071 RepID=A0A348AF67_9FIRM|nr:cytochrome c biogenesis protein CcdA [Methylomusa anaerophila]BBB89715.1 thiol:disulfide interchange protein DsbD precursor [Methylomusa anaerophila]HML89240.1 cytochrome c biogenesis protein CcdA [Methylomusa anaerophila]